MHVPATNHTFFPHAMQHNAADESRETLSTFTHTPRAAFDMPIPDWLSGFCRVPLDLGCDDCKIKIITGRMAYWFIGLFSCILTSLSVSHT